MRSGESERLRPTTYALHPRVILCFDMARRFRAFLLSGMLAASVAVFGFSASVVRAASVESAFTQINSSSDDSAVQGIIFAGVCETSVEAQGGTDTCACRDEGNCTLDDVLQVFANIAIFILGISGSAVLFVFVYGGYKWLFSRGDSKWVDAGKEAMTGAVIGLMIIFGSYVALNFIISGLTTESGTPSSDVLEDTVNQGLSDADRENAVEDVFTTDTE